MAADLSKIIVNAGEPVRMQHRDFPEIRAEGADSAEAAHHLEMQLRRVVDTATTEWRRAAIEQAIADVQAFAAGSG